ncbi:hypothetical protein Ancab_014263 [Ancistrocladus abbreviatus]
MTGAGAVDLVVGVLVSCAGASVAAGAAVVVSGCVGFATFVGYGAFAAILSCVAGAVGSLGLLLVQLMEMLPLLFLLLSLLLMSLFLFFALLCNWWLRFLLLANGVAHGGVAISFAPDAIVVGVAADGAEVAIGCCGASGADGVGHYVLALFSCPAVVGSGFVLRAGAVLASCFDYSSGF